MEEAFSCCPTPPNCGFSAFDVRPCGATMRLTTGEWLVEPRTTPVEPLFEVLSVIQQNNQQSGSNMYDIELKVGSECWTVNTTERDLRTDIYDFVCTSLPQDLDSAYQLAGKFPTRMRITSDLSDPSIYIQDYLEQLAIATCEKSFPPTLRAHIDRYLLGGRLGTGASMS